jgi:hypothetical protein
VRGRKGAARCQPTRFTVIWSAILTRSTAPARNDECAGDNPANRFADWRLDSVIAGGVLAHSAELHQEQYDRSLATKDAERCDDPFQAMAATRHPCGCDRIECVPMIEEGSLQLPRSEGASASCTRLRLEC